MLKCQWTLIHIQTEEQASEMQKQFNSVLPNVGAFDTETTGLHIIQDKPFLFQFGFIDLKNMRGYAYAVDIEQTPSLAYSVIKQWQSELAPKLNIYLGHNVKFDLHMMTNYGLPYLENNISDTMFYIRYAHDALTPQNGGPPLGLKDYAAQYIDISAKSHEKLLDVEKSNIAKELNLQLRQRLKKKYTAAQIKEMFKDPIIDIEDLPEDIQNDYKDWLQYDVPLYIQPKIRNLVEPNMIPYNKLNRKNLIKYALYDIVWTCEIYLATCCVAENRKNTKGIMIENQLIYPLYEMERVGFKVDVEYIKNARIKLKQYIKQRRKRLYEIAGQEFAIGQHQVIKTLFKNKFDIEIASTSNDNLEHLHSNLIRAKAHPDAIEFIELIEELRTLEKWYSVYIMRFIKDLRNTDRLYTTINQVGTVSGRVTSDFQQFPKNGIKTKDGEELFKPRRMVQVSGGDYDGIVYLDYSQIELRFQALYTILVGHPDLNLCRAYMPYQCHNAEGVPFDYNNPEHIKAWHKDWYLDENPEQKWTPTDVHGATTKAAFGIDETHPDFHDLRYIGKRVNFAKLILTNSVNFVIIMVEALLCYYNV